MGAVAKKQRINRLPTVSEAIARVENFERDAEHICQLRPRDFDGVVLRRRIDALEECLRELAAMTAAQAEDEGLWFNAMHASEGYLQQELRKLHAAIENKARALLEE